MEENIMQVRYQQNKLWERITFSIRPVAASMIIIHCFTALSPSRSWWLKK